MSNKVKVGILTIAVSVISGNVLAQDVDKIISQERAKQIAREISNNISRRRI